MGTLDLYSDDFPHGTPTGYDNGCRGAGACENHNTDLMTCSEAKIRWNSDFGYRKLLSAGLTPQQVYDADQATIAAVKAAGGGKTPKPAPQQRFTERLTTANVTPEDLAQDIAAPESDIPTPEPVNEDLLEPESDTAAPERDIHDGMDDKQKRGHYSKGCREQVCRDAVAKRAREVKAENHRTIRATRTTTVPEPATRPITDLTPANPAIGTTIDETALAADLPEPSIDEATLTFTSPPPGHRNDERVLLDLNAAQAATITELRDELRTARAATAQARLQLEEQITAHERTTQALTTALASLDHLHATRPTLHTEPTEAPALAEVVSVATGGGLDPIVVDAGSGGLTVHVTINVGR
jgi:hypothetical protein